MKKILEVLRYGEHDIRFHTDIDPKNDPEIINQTVTKPARPSKRAAANVRSSAPASPRPSLEVKSMRCLENRLPTLHKHRNGG